MPKKPSRPNAPLVLVGALLGGLLFAFFATTAIDLWSGRAVEGWQIEERLGLPIIAELRK
jgi:hypothetical protein